MKHTFKALLLLGVLLVTPALLGFNLSAQDNETFKLTGCWLFEKAEYLEQSSPGQSYQLKYTIANEEELAQLGSCYQDVVMRICFYNEEVAKVVNMFTAYIGSVAFPFGGSFSVGVQYPMIFGDLETIGNDSPIEGMPFNAPQIEYSIEMIDHDIIQIVVERPCFENGVIIQGLVKCVLKRETDNQ